MEGRHQSRDVATTTSSTHLLKPSFEPRKQVSGLLYISSLVPPQEPETASSAYYLQTFTSSMRLLGLRTAFIRGQGRFVDIDHVQGEEHLMYQMVGFNCFSPVLIYHNPSRACRRVNGIILRARCIGTFFTCLLRTFFQAAFVY